MQRMMAIFAGPLVLPILMAPTPVLSDRSSNDQLARDFVGSAIIILETEQRGGHIRKWLRPVHVALVGTVPPDVQPKIARDLHEVSSITHLDIDLTEPAAANFVVMLSDDLADDALGKYRALTLSFLDSEERARRVLFGDERKPRCRADAQFAGYEITGVMIFVPSARDRSAIDACLDDKLYKALGLFHDDPGIDDVKVRIERERLFLRILYDKRMSPGMSDQDAIRVGRELLQEIRPQL